MEISKYMDSNSVSINLESTLTRHKLGIELVFDDENNEKVIILNKVHNHAKSKKKNSIEDNQELFFVYIMNKGNS